MIKNDSLDMQKPPELGGFYLVAGDGLEPTTSGLCVRTYAKYRYDYTMIFGDNRRFLRIIENVFLTIINDY